MIKRGNVRVAGALVACASIVFMLSATPASSVELTGKPITARTFDRALGSTSGRALFLSIEGLQDLALGDGAGYLAYNRESLTTQIPVIPDELVSACGSGAVQLSGTGTCLSRAKLQQKGVPMSGNTVLEESLFKAGVTTRKTTETTSGLSQPIERNTTIGKGILAPLAGFLSARTGSAPSDATPPANPQGYADATGVLIPEIAQAKATCDARTGTGNVAESKTAFTLPDVLSPVLKGSLGLASCAITREASGTSVLPSLQNKFGEAEIDLTVTQTLVDSVPAVTELLGTLQGLVPDALAPVDALLAELQNRLDSAPLATIKIAPGLESITSSESGVVSNARTGEVVLDILGGLATVTITEAVSKASVLKGVPLASSECALVKIRALNLLTPITDDFLETSVACPQTSVSLLGGLPALGDLLKLSINAGQATNEQGCAPSLTNNPCTARSQVSVLDISLFSSPLPTIKLQLASSGAFAQTEQARSQNLVPLPVTGPGALAVLASGLGLSTVAVWIRRKVRRA